MFSAASVCVCVGGRLGVTVGVFVNTITSERVSVGR